MNVAAAAPVVQSCGKGQKKCQLEVQGEMKGILKSIEIRYLGIMERETEDETGHDRTQGFFQCDSHGLAMRI